MTRSLRLCLASLFLVSTAAAAETDLTLREVRTASSDVLVLVFNSEKRDAKLVDVSDASAWTVNAEPAKQLSLYVTPAQGCEHRVYLRTSRLEEGKVYTVATPYATVEFVFSPRQVLCESIKTNQVAYSALGSKRYAIFAQWLGTGGARPLEGELPGYQVLRMADGQVVAGGQLQELGPDASSGDHAYRIDLSAVPEGGPYQVVVAGCGSSHPFGVGGEFSRRLAHTIFRAQYLQRCGCPIERPDIRKDPCHTLIYQVEGPIGEANIVVRGTEPTFRMYGGYQDAGDADRRAYHMANPMVNLIIYEAFPDRFTDGQFDIPGTFSDDYHITGYANGIPDIIDEAEWGTLAWEYLQKDDGSILFGTETTGYPDPFAAPLDQDTKKYGTVKVDRRATSAGAGLFAHMARVIKPYKPERSKALLERAQRAMAFGGQAMADPEKLNYYFQVYLLTGDPAAHDQIRALYRVAGTWKDRRVTPPGYSLNDEFCDNPSYFLPYVLASDVPTDPEIVEFFKQAIRDTADANVAELNGRAYPVGNNSAQGGWGHNVNQPQYACAPLLQWRLSGEASYLDAACQLMDYRLGLNPLGVSYVTGLGFQQVHNVHDRESAYTQGLGWGAKPGITVFGPGTMRRTRTVLPATRDLARERQFVDDRDVISCTEFTIFETMQYDALYTVLAGGGVWTGGNPYGENAIRPALRIEAKPQPARPATQP
jgi:endoglucanase